MTAKLQFGNDEHIKLKKLAEQIDECVVIKNVNHDCNCNLCTFEEEHCTSCGEKKEDLFDYINMQGEILECQNCGQKGVYQRTINELKFKIENLNNKENGDKP